MNRILAFSYGTLCYVIFLTTFLYAIAFIGNIGVAQTIEAAPALGQAVIAGQVGGAAFDHGR